MPSVVSMNHDATVEGLPTVYCGVYHTLLDGFSMVDISTVIIVGIVGIVAIAGILPVPKRPALETPRRELSEDVSFGIGTGTLLDVEQSTLEDRPMLNTVLFSPVSGVRRDDEMYTSLTQSPTTLVWDVRAIGRARRTWTTTVKPHKSGSRGVRRGVCQCQACLISMKPVLRLNRKG